MNKKFNLVINRRSGILVSGGKADLTNKLEKHLDERLQTVSFVEPSEFSGFIDYLSDTSPLPILIGGGDGTALSAAKILKEKSIPIGILPLGTMNLLAQDLGIPVDLEDAISAYAGNLQTDLIDVGNVNGNLFLCSAIFGFVPETSIKREKMRAEKSIRTWAELIATLARSIAGTEPKQLMLQYDGESFEVSSDAVVVSNNSYIENPQKPGDRLLRPSLKNGKLGTYIARPQSIAENLRLLFRVWKGNWQEDSSIITFESEHLRLWPDGKTREGSEILLSLDGEPVTFHSPLDFRIEKSALRVIFPARPPDDIPPG